MTEARNNRQIHSLNPVVVRNSPQIGRLSQPAPPKIQAAGAGSIAPTRQLTAPY